METENIDAAIPDRTLVNDSSTNGEFCIENDGYTLVQQSVGGTALFLCVKHNILSVCYQINESITICEFPPVFSLGQDMTTERFTCNKSEMNGDSKFCPS